MAMPLGAFVPDEEAARWIEAWLRAVDPALAAGVWPGWDPARQAVGLALPGGGGWCVARAAAAGGRAVADRTGGTLPGVARLADAPRGGAGAGAVLARALIPGVSACVLRDSVVPTLADAAPLPDLAARAAAALFALWWAGDRAAPVPAARAWEPAEAEALAVVEGRVLLAALGGDARAPEVQASWTRLATQLALLRRERYACLEPEDGQAGEEGEAAGGQGAFDVGGRALEVVAGLPAFVGAGCAAALADGGSGTAPPPELAAGLADLGEVPQPARRRLTGWGLATLLSRLEAAGPRDAERASGRAWAPRRAFPQGWRVALREGVGLDRLLEAHVTFDGGSRDDAALAAALAAHGHADALTRSRAAAAAAEHARTALLAGILQGTGTLLVVDVRGLGAGRVAAPRPAELVHAGLAVHPAGVTFTYPRGTLLAFSGVPVAEDRRAGLLQVRVRGRLHLAGDGTALGAAAADFSQGLELQVPGVRIRARTGSIQPVEGGFLLRLLA